MRSPSGNAESFIRRQIFSFDRSEFSEECRANSDAICSGCPESVEPGRLI